MQQQKKEELKKMEKTNKMKAKSEVTDYDLFKKFQSNQHNKMASMEEKPEELDLRKKRLAEEQAAFVDNKRKVMMGAFN